MPNDLSLKLYLQGHYAGSEAARQTVRQLGAVESGGETGELLAQLGREIAEDQSSLRDIMARLDVSPDVVKNQAALATATVARFMLRVQSVGDAQSRLIGLESLSLGVEGKASLWRVLREIAEGDPRLADVDFDALVERAERQRQDLGPHVLRAAMQAAGHASPTGLSHDVG